MSKFTKIITAAVAAATLAVGAGSAAQAHDFRGNGPRGYSHGPAPRAYAPPPRAYYGHGGGYRRDRTGNRIATGIAIGVGAAILGSIIANQNRGGYDRY